MPNETPHEHRRPVKKTADWRLPTFALFAIAAMSCVFDCAADEPSATESRTNTSTNTHLNLHLFGFSYHPDRKGTRDKHLDNELNVGLGINYEFQSDAQGVSSTEAGFYKDSGSNWAKYVGVGYRFRLGRRWKLGADVLAVQSPTYNQGQAFVAPIPHLSVDLGVAKINAIYIPKFQEYNLFTVFAVYLTIPLKSW